MWVMFFQIEGESKSILVKMQLPACIGERVKSYRHQGGEACCPLEQFEWTASVSGKRVVAHIVIDPHLSSLFFILEVTCNSPVSLSAFSSVLHLLFHVFHPQAAANVSVWEFPLLITKTASQTRHVFKCQRTMNIIVAIVLLFKIHTVALSWKFYNPSHTISHTVVNI